MDGQTSFEHQSRACTFTAEVLGSEGALTSSFVYEMASFYSERTSRYSLQFLLKQCADNPASVFERYGSILGVVDVRHSTADKEVAVVSLSRQDLTCHVAVLPSSQPGIWELITESKASSAEYQRVLSPVLDRLGSVIVGGWMSSKQLNGLLQDMEKSTSCRIKPSRVASKGRGRSSVDWLDASSLGLVLSELEQRRSTLKSLAFTLVDPTRGREVVKGSVTKLNRVSYKSGSFFALRKYLIDPMTLMLAQQTHSIESELSESPFEKPIVFAFDAPQLGDRTSHERLLETVASLPRVAVSAFHMNPYMHVSVVDYDDGSTMDLFSNDASSVVFVPGPRCSSSAVLRVSSQLYSEFASGKLERAVHDAFAGAIGFGDS